MAAAILMYESIQEWFDVLLPEIDARHVGRELTRRSDPKQRDQNEIEILGYVEENHKKKQCCSHRENDTGKNNGLFGRCVRWKRLSVVGHGGNLVYRLV